MKKKFLGFFLVFLLVFTVSCGNAKDKIIGKWLCDNTVVEFTKDGRFLAAENGDEQGYYELRSGGKILFYTEGAKEDGIPLQYKFKKNNLYIGKLKYTPYKK